MHRREPVHFSEILQRMPWRPARSAALATLLALLPLLAFAEEKAEEDAEIDGTLALLDAAEAAERQGHLIYPARGSAMSLYHEVLYADPDNAHAVEGLTRLAEHHLEAAQAAVDKGQLLKAESLVSKARMIYPDYPGVAALTGQISLLHSAERTRQTLDWRLVAERSPRLEPTLRKLGGVAKAGDCRVTINVSNDAEGRWIFQKMNQADGEGRIRAEVKIASPAAVDILCFPGSAETDAG